MDIILSNLLANLESWRVMKEPRTRDKELAKILGLPVGYYSELINHKGKNPTIRTIGRLAKAIGVDPWLLIAPNAVFLELSGINAE